MHCFYLCLQVIQNRGVNKTYNHTVVAQLDAKMFLRKWQNQTVTSHEKENTSNLYATVVEVASFVTLNEFRQEPKLI